MAGQFELLYVQSFSSVSSVTVTHNLDRLQVGVIARIGATSRNDLIYSIVPSISDPRNEVVVTFVGTQSGEILISDTDYVFANIPTPENSAQVSQLTSSAYSPGGADTQVQFNDGGSSFSGSANFAWLKASNVLSVDGVISGSGNVSGSAFYGDGSNLAGIDLLTGNVVYVDAVNGDDTTGASGNHDLPFLTIAAALAAASSGDTVMVYPGTYDESGLTIPTGVTLHGLDRLRCIISPSGVNSITVVTMGENTCLENMSIEASSAAFPTGGRSLVFFPSTTSATSVARNLLLTGVAGAVSGISVGGTATSTNNWVTVDHVDVKGSGVSNGILCATSGYFVVRDCIIYGLIGASVTAGSVELQDCKLTGLAGLSIAAATTAYVNQGTRWSSLNNLGSLLSAGLYFNPPSILTYSTPSNNNIITAVNSTTVQGEANLTFDGTTLAITGDISGSGNISGSAFYGDGTNLTGPIQESIVDAKGDLLIATGADTIVRFPVGTNRQVLKADSAQTEGVAWASLPEAKFANWYNNAAYSGITTSASTLPFPDTRISNAAFTIDGSGEEITINTAGTYRIDFGASSAEASGTDLVADMWLELDTGSGFAEVEGTRSRWFHDNNGEEGGNSSFAIIVLAATDVFRVRAQVVNGETDTLNTLANSLRLNIQTVGADGATGATGPQGPSGSGSTIIVEDEGSIVAGGPHSNLDFVGAGVTVTNAGSGVATITIPGGGSANIAQYRATANLTINTSATTVPLNANDFEDSNYTRVGDNITINTGGVYKISYNIFFTTTGNFRRTIDGWVERNTSVITPSSSSDYARNNIDNTGSAGCTFMVQLAVGDVIRLRCQSTGTNGTCQGEGNRMWICLEFLRAP